MSDLTKKTDSELHRLRDRALTASLGNWTTNLGACVHLAALAESCDEELKRRASNTEGQ